MSIRSWRWSLAYSKGHHGPTQTLSWLRPPQETQMIPYFKNYRNVSNFCYVLLIRDFYSTMAILSFGRGALLSYTVHWFQISKSVLPTVLCISWSGEQKTNGSGFIGLRNNQSWISITSEKKKKRKIILLINRNNLFMTLGKDAIPRLVKWGWTVPDWNSFRLG